MPPFAEFSLDLDLRDELFIDATSAIDVTGRGYLGGHTAGNTTVGAASRDAGGADGAQETCRVILGARN